MIEFKKIDNWLENLGCMMADLIVAVMAVAVVLVPVFMMITFVMEYLTGWEENFDFSKFLILILLNITGFYLMMGFGKVNK